jgi:hypothetical protein
LPQDWLDRRFPPPASIWQRLFGGEDLLKLSRRLPHPIVWGMRLETAEAERELADLEKHVAAFDARRQPGRAG